MVAPLTVLQREFPAVQVGSYPDYSEANSYSVRVALESRELELVEKVCMATSLVPRLSSPTLLINRKEEPGDKASMATL